ncbi:hypothetical protein CRYUN_Cryun04dG0109700 [Craigia yunnanensis]
MINMGSEARSRNMKDLNVEGEYSEPVSPTGQCFQQLTSSVLSICVLGVLDSEIPIDDSPTMALLKISTLEFRQKWRPIASSDLL